MNWRTGTEMCAMFQEFILGPELLELYKDLLIFNYI